MKRVVFICFYITMQLALLFSRDSLTDSYLLSSEWKSSDYDVEIIFAPGKRVTLVDRYSDAVLHFEGSYRLERGELFLSLNLNIEESLSLHRDLSSEKIEVRYRLLNDLNTVEYDHFLILDEVIRAEGTESHMLKLYRLKWKRITNLTSKLKEGTARVFNGTEVVTIDRRLATNRENIKVRVAPERDANYYIWYRESGDYQEPPFMPEGTRVILRARTVRKEWVEGHYNYWYYIDISDLHPLDEGIYLNGDKRGRMVYYGFWVFGQFIKPIE